jgi:hypothetical protein
VSVAGDIADAIVTAVEALALTGVTVKRRKLPSLPQGEDPPQVVVSIGDEPDTEYLTAVENLNRYPVAVTIVTAGGKKLADDETLRTWRQSVRRTLDDLERTTFAAVTGFNRVTTGGKSPFNPQALAKDLNYSVQVFTVEVLEQRATT